MKLKPIFYFIFFSFGSIVIFTSCGDLDPEVQDKRKVVLNMDFQKRSSSRNSANISSSELSNYNTHLIVAVPSSEQLNINYLSYYYSAYYADLLNTQDNRVTMEIPINTDLKIFAFLFQVNYSLDDLYSYREVGAYGASGSFSINNQTNSISLGISLQSNGESSSTDTNNSSIEEVTAIGATNDSTPNYTFASTIAGTITYGGSCSSSRTSAIVGNNTITLNFLSNGTYSNCTIKVADSAGNESNTISITEFTIIDTTLLAHYKFEDDLNDSSSYGLNLESSDGTVYFTTDSNRAPDGKAGYFNGSTYVFTEDIDIESTDNFTIAFWVRAHTNAWSVNNETEWRIDMDQWDSVMSTGNSTGGGIFQIDYDGYGNLRFNISGLSNSQIITLDNNTEWHHFVYARHYESGTWGNRRIVKYKNGEPIGLTTVSVDTLWELLKIGINRTGGGYWKGFMDDFRLYNRTFTPDEVEELYESY